MKLRKVSVAAVAALALAGSVTACSNSADDEGKIKIGIKYDQPGMGQKTTDGYAGFEIDVARYIAKELGYDEKDIEFKETKSADRETALKNGDVKFIVATYSITPERDKQVDFAGPYFLAHQDLLTRADDPIKKGADLNGKKLCSVAGSTSAQNIKEGTDTMKPIAPNAELRKYGTYSECISGLASGAVDALTTDDAILAGYASQQQNKGKFALSGLQLTNENYGVGVKDGDKKLVDKINKAIEKMVSSGAWEEAVKKNLGASGYKNEPAPKIGDLKK